MEDVKRASFQVEWIRIVSVYWLLIAGVGLEQILGRHDALNFLHFLLKILYKHEHFGRRF